MLATQKVSLSLEHPEEGLPGVVVGSGAQVPWQHGLQHRVGPVPLWAVPRVLLRAGASLLGAGGVVCGRREVGRRGEGITLSNKHHCFDFCIVYRGLQVVWGRLTVTTKEIPKKKIGPAGDWAQDLLITNLMLLPTELLEILSRGAVGKFYIYLSPKMFFLGKQSC